MTIGWFLLGERDADPERATDVEAAFDGDFPPDRLDEVLDDRESEAGPPLIPGAMAINAVETLENARELIAWDTNAGVFDLNDPLSGLGFPAESD